MKRLLAGGSPQQAVARRLGGRPGGLGPVKRRPRAASPRAQRLGNLCRLFPLPRRWSCCFPAGVPLSALAPGPRLPSDPRQSTAPAAMVKKRISNIEHLLAAGRSNTERRTDPEAFRQARSTGSRQVRTGHFDIRHSMFGVRYSLLLTRIRRHMRARLRQGYAVTSPASRHFAVAKLRPMTYDLLPAVGVG